MLGPPRSSWKAGRWCRGGVERGKRLEDLSNSRSPGLFFSNPGKQAGMGQKNSIFDMKLKAKARLDDGVVRQPKSVSAQRVGRCQQGNLPRYFERGVPGSGVRSSLASDLVGIRPTTVTNNQSHRWPALAFDNCWRWFLLAVNLQTRGLGEGTQRRGLGCITLA